MAGSQRRVTTGGKGGVRGACTKSFASCMFVPWSRATMGTLMSDLLTVSMRP